MRLTVGRMERRLRRALTEPGFTLSLRYLPDYAGLMKRGHKDVLINPFHGGLTETVVHELIHKCYHPQTEFWGKVLCEAVVTALEGEIVSYINSDGRRQEWWHRKIQEKLPEE